MQIPFLDCSLIVCSNIPASPRAYASRDRVRTRYDGPITLEVVDDPLPADAWSSTVGAFEQREFVTENAPDFDRIVRNWATTGELHGGVVFTSPPRLHRGSLS